MLPSLAAYLFAFFLIKNYSKIAYCSWNTERGSYKGARRMLLLAFFTPLAYLAVTGGDGFYPFAVHEIGKTFTGTPIFTVLSITYVSVIFTLDVNYKSSRKNGFERNFIRHVVLGWFFVIPFVACFLICKLPVGVLFVVASFTQAPKSIVCAQERPTQSG
jgi:hypothetical protein